MLRNASERPRPRTLASHLTWRLALLCVWSQVLDEEYLEWADVLAAALDAASEGRPLRLVDVGAGEFGLWAVRAAAAFQRLRPDLGCELLLVEPMLDEELLAEHLALNLKPCNVTVHQQSLSTADELKTLLTEGEWDFMDIDAQGTALRFRSLKVFQRFKQLVFRCSQDLSILCSWVWPTGFWAMCGACTSPHTTDGSIGISWTGWRRSSLIAFGLEMSSKGL